MKVVVNILFLAFFLIPLITPLCANSESCLNQVYKALIKNNSDSLKLAIGDKLYLEHPQGEKEKVIYLGNQNNRIFFFRKKTEKSSHLTTMKSASLPPMAKQLTPNLATCKKLFQLKNKMPLIAPCTAPLTAFHFSTISNELQMKI